MSDAITTTPHPLRMRERAMIGRLLRLQRRAKGIPLVHALDTMTAICARHGLPEIDLLAWEDGEGHEGMWSRAESYLAQVLDEKVDGINWLVTSLTARIQKDVPQFRLVRIGAIEETATDGTWLRGCFADSWIERMLPDLWKAAQPIDDRATGLFDGEDDASGRAWLLNDADVFSEARGFEPLSRRVIPTSLLLAEGRAFFQSHPRAHTLRLHRVGLHEEGDIVADDGRRYEYTGGRIDAWSSDFAPWRISMRTPKNTTRAGS